MSYGKIDANGVLVQRQPYHEAGFIQIPDGVVCGMVTADGGQTFTTPAVPVDLTFAAMNELEHTDLVALRCFKANVAFPAEWKTYATALRSIVNGTDTTSTSLPIQPPYPVGT